MGILKVKERKKIATDKNNLQPETEVRIAQD